MELLITISTTVGIIVVIAVFLAIAYKGMAHGGVTFNIRDHKWLALALVIPVTTFFLWKWWSKKETASAKESAGLETAISTLSSYTEDTTGIITLVVVVALGVWFFSLLLVKKDKVAEKNTNDSLTRNLSGYIVFLGITTLVVMYAKEQYWDKDAIPLSGMTPYTGENTPLALFIGYTSAVLWIVFITIGGWLSDKDKDAPNQKLAAQAKKFGNFFGWIAFLSIIFIVGSFLLKIMEEAPPGWGESVSKPEKVNVRLERIGHGQSVAHEASTLTVFTVSLPTPHKVGWASAVCAEIISPKWLVDQIDVIQHHFEFTTPGERGFVHQMRLTKEVRFHLTEKELSAIRVKFHLIATQGYPKDAVCRKTKFF